MTVGPGRRRSGGAPRNLTDLEALVWPARRGYSALAPAPSRPAPPPSTPGIVRPPAARSTSEPSSPSGAINVDFDGGGLTGQPLEAWAHEFTIKSPAADPGVVRAVVQYPDLGPVLVTRPLPPGPLGVERVAWLLASGQFKRGDWQVPGTMVAIGRSVFDGSRPVHGVNWWNVTWTSARPASLSDGLTILRTAMSRDKQQEEVLGLSDPVRHRLAVADESGKVSVVDLSAARGWVSTE